MHIDGVPVSVLFLPAPKLPASGYRWAPASFNICGDVSIPTNVPAFPTECGLSVALPGLFLDTPCELTTRVIACYVSMRPTMSAGT
jgi:hypothetical protein